MFVIQELFRQFHIPGINRVFKNSFEGKGTDGMRNLPLHKMFILFFFSEKFSFFFQLSPCDTLSCVRLFSIVSLESFVIIEGLIRKEIRSDSPRFFSRLRNNGCDRFVCVNVFKTWKNVRNFHSYGNIGKSELNLMKFKKKNDLEIYKLFLFSFFCGTFCCRFSRFSTFSKFSTFNLFKLFRLLRCFRPF